MLSNHLILCHPLLLLPSIFPSIRVSSNESVLCIRWPKYWSVSFSISPSNEYSELISFRMDWLNLLAVQGTLKSLLQHQSSKASILHHSTFFIVQLSHPYMTILKLKIILKKRERERRNFLQCRRHRKCSFDPWVGKFPWRRAWQPAPVFLPGESHGQRSLVGYSPWGHRVEHE